VTTTTTMLENKVLEALGPKVSTGKAVLATIMMQIKVIEALGPAGQEVSIGGERATNTMIMLKNTVQEAPTVDQKAASTGGGKVTNTITTIIITTNILRNSMS